MTGFWKLASLQSVLRVELESKDSAAISANETSEMASGEWFPAGTALVFPKIHAPACGLTGNDISPGWRRKTTTHAPREGANWTQDEAAKHCGLLQLTPL